MSLNHELSDLFRTLAALMDIKGESPFKSIAFSKVSRLLKDMTLDLRQAVETGEVKNIQGIGASSQRIIEQYVKTGRSEDFDEVAAAVPAGLIPMLDISGLGPKTIALLWKERNITSVEQLSEAIVQKKLDGIKGLGDKKIDAIRQGIEQRAKASGRIGIVDALPVAAAMLQQLQKIPGITSAAIAGSLRRGQETIGDIDLVAALADGVTGQTISDLVAKFPEVERVLAQGNTKTSILTATGIQVDVRFVPAANFGAALQYFTGSKDHNTRLRGLAQDQKMTLNEWGLYRLADYDKAKKIPGHAPSAKTVASKTEAEIYAALGLDFVEPELREDRGEIDASRDKRLPKLITLADIRGDLHTHTTASDGQNSIEQMCQAALAKNYQFLAITDHSKSQVIANGLTAERLLKHVAAIHKAADKFPALTLLAGCEVDILADGSMDFEDAVLAELDFVVGSPHIALKQPADKATDRILRAIDNRYVTIIGHPTGRLIFGREGLPLNFEKIFAAAAANGTAMEINASFPRLDLNDAHAKAAIAAGVKLSINTDAHSTGGFDEMPFGVQVARRAWAQKTDVINCFTPQQLRAFISAKRSRAK